MNACSKGFAILLLLFSIAGLAPFSHAEEYNLSYGARLTEANGAPILGQDGKLDLEVSFYNAGSGGSPIGPSPISFAGTGVSEGVFQLSITLTPTDFHQVFQDPSTPVYIEVKDVKSGAVFPRQRFSVIPFALKTPIDNDTIIYSSDGKLTVGSSVGTVKQITAGSGLTGGTITDSGTITVDVGTTGNKIVQLSDGKLPSVDGSNLSGVNAEKLQTRSVSAAVPVSGQVLKWSGSAWVPSSDLVGETGSGEANTASNVTSGSGVGLFKTKVSADLRFYSLSPGAGVTVNLAGDDVVIASTITQYTDAMAKAAAVADSITDSVTSMAPSQNAVFDALAGKQSSVTTSTDLNLNSITTNAVNALTINPGVSTGEIKLKELSVNGTNYVGLKAPGSIASDLTFTLPGGAGTNGQFLKTDGSGNLSWTDQASAPVSSVNTLTGAVTLTTTNISEGTNLYYTDARAKAAAVGDAITDAVTDKAPSQNAVFDALALKSPTTHNHDTTYEPKGLSADVVTTTKILNDAVTSAKIASGVDAAKIGDGSIDNTEFGYLNGVTSAIQTQLNGKVVGPTSATDNAIARFDGTTGKIVQNSGVVIDDSGKVGIGTASPLEKFDVNGNIQFGDYILSSRGSSGGYFGKGSVLISGGGTADTGILTSGNILFGTNAGAGNYERMRITTGGNVGIGTASPSSPLTVSGVIESQSGGIKFPDGTTQNSAAVSSSITARSTIGGRLTLSSGIPVTTNDMIGSGTIYYTPYIHDLIGLYDGVTTWRLFTFVDMSLSLSGLTSGKNYDVFIYNNSGTPSIELGTAWTSDTLRATDLVRQNGILVQSGNSTRRYLGTLRATSSSTTEDSKAKRFLWNYNNRLPRILRVRESTVSWEYCTNAARPANNNTANRVEILSGDPGLRLRLHVTAYAYKSNVGSHSVFLSEDSISSNVVSTGGFSYFSLYSDLYADLTRIPVMGYHYYQWGEYDNGACTTFYGGAADTAYGIDGEFDG